MSARLLKRFHEAVQRGKAAEVGELLDRFPQWIKRRFDGSPVLNTAAGRGRKSIVKLLLARGADPNGLDGFGDTPLTHAHDAETAKLLIAGGADVNHWGKYFGITPLHFAIGNRRDKVAEVLLQNGADVNKPDDRGETALHKACSRNDKACTAVLLKYGAKTEIQNAYGFTPLYSAISHNKPQDAAVLLKMLVRYGANVDVDHSNGFSVLGSVCSSGDVEQVRQLIKAGADVNRFQKSGSAPLHIAVRSARPEVVAVLLKAGADPQRKSRSAKPELKGKTAADLARESPNDRIRKYAAAWDAAHKKRRK